MLPKQYRLSLKTELARIKKDNRIFPGNFFGLLVAPQLSKTKDSFPRIAFIVSKKIHLKANRRNRVRRLMREAARALLPQFRPGWDFVFLAKRTILGKTLAEVKAETERILNEKIYPSTN
ncbi:ribonuclease P protein component [Candidatus Shapirobacteria bacterium CG09_land_8_20_14_0_10_47_13]|uniref:Ribonuclease P protein component n=1 Tax=Candidatus Shapirobacteria bacterium CG09_land_8_20_14_0_10_47_13 TaxID=1974481 RepID=A0A2H0WNL5_9BACT|nr:MAG: ribonuclease P protein component [Candidatus Shapirobacteria bacterium CG09_land_8_20_14_0_10_47_13]